MEEIKVGEYFRSKSIGIMKFIYGTSYITKDNKEDYIYYLEYENHKTMPLSAKGLKDMKHSLNIIDLIEVGDYVNGKKIIDTYLDGANSYIKYEHYTGTRIYNKDIKSIVTKEMMESIEYKVGD